MKQTISNRQGKQLAVYTDGLKDAPVLVFSNSLGTDHGMWQPQVDELKSHFNVITYDTRGHGGSDVISDTSLQNLAEDVVDILDALNIEKLILRHINGRNYRALVGYSSSRALLSITVANSAAKIGQAEAWLSRADSVEQNGLAELVKPRIPAGLVKTSTINITWLHKRRFKVSQTHQHKVMPMHVAL